MLCSVLRLIKFEDLVGSVIIGTRSLQNKVAHVDEIQVYFDDMLSSFIYLFASDQSKE